MISMVFQREEALRRVSEFIKGTELHDNNTHHLLPGREGRAGS